MHSLVAARRWPQLYRRQALPIRVLSAAAGMLTAAAMFAAPAEADGTDDAFLNALTAAGVNSGAPEAAESMGRQVCTDVAAPGGSFAAAAQRARGGSAMSASMAGMFATIAIQMYCPTMVSQVASGDLSGLQNLSGMAGQAAAPGVASVPAIPAMPAMPAMPKIPGLGS